MKRNCPKLSCKSERIIKDGTYFRRNDSRKIQRFVCKDCSTKFSASTGTLEFKQKKRRVNELLLSLFCAKVTQKRAARIAKVNKKTVARRFDYWARKAKIKNVRFNQKLRKSQVNHLQFDDLITKEKTKLKPATVTVAVDAKRRFILSSNVAQIPAFGHLAKLSKKKYGYRKSEHLTSLTNTFETLKPIVKADALIESDEHKNYDLFVRSYFPSSDYRQYKSQKATVAGQGELKNKNYDPIFCINQTLAMMRDGISTFVRRTWCTTQSLKKLQGHLEIFIYYYNQRYLGGLSPRKGGG